ncbi:MAG: excisionase [Pirellulaceae bacterium]|nr:MAG: excisionase [Pirellulaceae bacterium]
MSSFVPLEEAAKRLGVTTDELVEMRSRGEIFGYRDGGSWKFKPEEIERVLAERAGGEALDEDPGGSSLALGGDELTGSSAQSDVALVADSGTGSDVRLVPSGEEPDLALDEDDDDELSLLAEDGEDLLATVNDKTAGAGSGSDIPLEGSDIFDLKLAEGSNVLSGSEVELGKEDGSGGLIQGDSGRTPGSGDLDIEGSDLQLADDDLDLADGSDLVLGADSGINLMSPSDSGISLEDEPLDLAASGISGLDLAEEGSDPEIAAAGSGVDFAQDEEFQLSPSGALDVDDDSGSQVIELEDSSDFGDQAVALDDSGLEAIEDIDGGGLDAAGDELAAPAAVPVQAEVGFGLFEVLGLLTILLIMGLSGILVSDIARNMWAWSGNHDALTSGFGEMIISIVNR